MAGGGERREGGGFCLGSGQQHKGGRRAGGLGDGDRAPTGRCARLPALLLPSPSSGPTLPVRHRIAPCLFRP